MVVYSSLASHAGVFRGARISSLRAPLKMPAWEANSSPAINSFALGAALTISVRGLPVTSSHRFFFLSLSCTSSCHESATFNTLLKYTYILTYSCMPNMKSVISSHSKYVLSNLNSPTQQPDNWNCRKKNRLSTRRKGPPIKCHLPSHCNHSDDN